MKDLRYILLAVVIGVFACVHASAQSRNIVRFLKGTHSTSAHGVITGYRYVDYVLGARAGQSMIVELRSNNDKAQIAVFDPDNETVEFGFGASGYSGTLEKNGNYVVRVLMSRAEARRKGSKTTFDVTFTIQ